MLLWPFRSGESLTLIVLASMSDVMQASAVI